MRHIKWLKILLIIIFVLVIGGTGWAVGLKNINQKIACNNIEVNVLTQVNKDNIIQNQKITFIDKSKGIKIKEININNRDYPLTKISCLKSSSDNMYYLEFYYTTGGSCVQCEYYELYNEHGKLILSDKEKIYLKITEDKMGKILPKSEAVKLNRILKKYEYGMKKLKLLEINKIWIKED